MTHDRQLERKLALEAIDRLVQWLSRRYENDRDKVGQTLARILLADNSCAHEFGEKQLRAIAADAARRHGVAL